MAIDGDALLAHLNMTGDEADEIDQASIVRVLAAAFSHTEAQLGFKLTDTAEFPNGPPADVEQAILMLAAHWFENREASIVGVAAMPLPMGYDAVIREHRSYTFG